MIFKLNLKSNIDRLKDRYEALVRDAHLIRIQNPNGSAEKLKKAAIVQNHIDELRQAQNN